MSIKLFTIETLEISNNKMTSYITLKMGFNAYTRGGRLKKN